MTATPEIRVLVLGADGFIGRHFCYAFRQAGWTVLAVARRPGRLARMGFATLAADLTDPQTHDAAFWRSHLAGVSFVVNTAGLLTGSESAMRAVHETAPGALYTAMPDTTRGLLISAVGIDAADTRFARLRRAGETVAGRHGITILRAGLVLGDTSYGGSSLARALSVLPWRMPVVGDGAQPFNPIHAEDLAHVVRDLLVNPPGDGVHQIGGPETVTQAGMLAALRAWIGLPPVPVLCLPVGVARTLGAVGDALRMGPISRTSVDQLCAGVVADSGTLLDNRPIHPRGFSAFTAERPAGTQDLWHAQLYLLRPVLRLSLVLLWLASGLIGLTLPPDDFLPLIPAGPVPDAALIALARAGGAADLAIALALLRRWRPRLMTWLQGALIGLYTVIFSLLAPGLWLLPLGGLLKNLPLLGLVVLSGVLEEER